MASGTWWTTIRHPGQTRYGYYVMVDDDTHAWVGDPYATQVEWTPKAPWGVLPRQRCSTFAGRTAPGARRRCAIWSSTKYVCVTQRASGTATAACTANFERLRSLIPHIVRTGVNAIELMPIQAFPGDSSWGYNPVFYHAIANTYGEPARLQGICQRVSRAAGSR